MTGRDRLTIDVTTDKIIGCFGLPEIDNLNDAKASIGRAADFVRKGSRSVRDDGTIFFTRRASRVLIDSHITQLLSQEGDSRFFEVMDIFDKVFSDDLSNLDIRKMLRKADELMSGLEIDITSELSENIFNCLTESG